MDYDIYFERRLNEVHEIFSSKQVRKFVEQCINDAKSRLSPLDSAMEEELGIRRGTLKTIPEILSTGDTDSKKYKKTETIFYKMLREFVVDFDDELRKIREYYESFPLEVTYKVYYLSNSVFGSDQMIISKKTDKVIFSTENGTVDFDLINGRQFIIKNENNEIREVTLDRPIRDEFEEIICGLENLIGVDKTLIRTERLVLVSETIELKKYHLENIALYLANEKLQRSIYPQDIFLFSKFQEEVQRFRYNNRWYKIIMPKVLVDAYVKYLYHFKSYVYEVKGINIDINFSYESEFVILQIDSGEQLSEYIIGEWLEEFLFYLTDETNIVNIKDPISKKKVEIQTKRFFEDVGLEEIRYNTTYEIEEQLKEILKLLRKEKSGIQNLIIYGGHQQFADTIINRLKLK